MCEVPSLVVALTTYTNSPKHHSLVKLKLDARFAG